MRPKQINRDARLSILNGFERRGVSNHEIWEEFAEKEALPRPSSVLDRVEADFGPAISVQVGDELAAEVRAVVGQRRVIAWGDPMVAGQVVNEAVSQEPERFLPLVLPDELFGSLIETAWGLLAARDLDSFAQSLGSLYPGLDSSWLNQILEKQRAPCRLVEGVIEWTTPDLAAERTLSDALGDWPELRSEIQGIREEFRRAEGADDFNALGARCDRALETLANLSFDLATDVPHGQTPPGAGDAKAKLELFLRARGTGKLGKAGTTVATGLPKAAYDLAQHVKHDRGAKRATAAAAISSLCTLVDFVAALTDT